MTTAELVLSRFPRHLDLDAPGKLMGDVVGGLSTAVDAQIVQVGKVRQARRIGEFDQLADFGRIVALHGASVSILDALARRVRATDPLVSYDAWLDVARRMAGDLFVLQRDESATVAGLLGATAAYLGLVVEDLDSDAGGYWHLARCSDRLLPGPPEEPTEWLLALEENPPQLADLGPSPFAHGARFSVMRQGFDPVPATVIVGGIADRTVRPMVVNVDDGFGVVATFAVADGATLRFERDGRVELDGTSVVRTCFTFSGAVFADALKDHPKDFVFDIEVTPPDPAAPRPEGDRRGVFVVTHPPDDAFDAVASLPHGDGLLPFVHLDRRETRFAAFVGAGFFAADLGPGGVRSAAPDPVAGYFDESVYLPEGPPAGAPAFEIGFEWDEREAYAARVWLPAEFEDLDEDDEAPLREVTRGLLDRHRAAGVHLYVAHADPRWTLGTGVIRDLDTESALGVVVAGTAAWDDSTEQPGGGT